MLSPLNIRIFDTPRPESARILELIAALVNIKDSRSIGDIVRSLTLIWEVLDLEEMQRRVEFI
jgi:hypothetical protein